MTTKLSSMGKHCVIESGNGEGGFNVGVIRFGLQGDINLEGRTWHVQGGAGMFMDVVNRVKATKNKSA